MRESDGTCVEIRNGRCLTQTRTIKVKQDFPKVVIVYRTNSLLLNYLRRWLIIYG